MYEPLTDLELLCMEQDANAVMQAKRQADSEGYFDPKDLAFIALARSTPLDEHCLKLIEEIRYLKAEGVDRGK